MGKQCILIHGVLGRTVDQVLLHRAEWGFEHAKRPLFFTKVHLNKDLNRVGGVVVENKMTFGFLACHVLRDQKVSS